MGAGERPQGEREGRKQPEERAHCQRTRIHAECDRGREQRCEEAGHHQRGESADREPREHSESRQRRQLDQVCGEHDTSGSSNALERRDDGEPGIEPRPNRVADADSAHEQGGEADQGEERAQAFHHLLDAGGGVFVGAHLPSRAAEPGPELRSHSSGPFSLFQAKRVLVVDQAAFTKQPGFGEGIESDHDPRPESEGSARPGAVRLAHDGAPNLELDAADGERCSFLEFEALDQGGIDERAPDPAAAGEGSGRRDRAAVVALGFQCAEERIAPVHRLELDEHARIRVRGPRHRAHLGEVGVCRRRALDQLSLIRAQVPIDGAERKVAAEDFPPVGAQSGHDGARGGLHAGNGGDAECEASQEHPQTAEPAKPLAQLARGNAKGYVQHDASTARAGARGGMRIRGTPDGTMRRWRLDGRPGTDPSGVDTGERYRRDGPSRPVSPLHGGGRESAGIFTPSPRFRGG